MDLIFYDFEVFKYDWLVVLINPRKKEKTVIINDKDKLSNFYEKHKGDIWVGYNSKNYDQYILKGILLDFNPYKINEFIITKGNDGWKYSNAFNSITLLNYDVMTSMHGLKQLEGFMGNNIKESSVPFNIDRKLTEDEIKETVKYCTSDVLNTIQVFIKRKAEFDAIGELIYTFKLPIECISKTKAQLSAIILGCNKTNRNDERDIKLVNTLRLNKYKYVAEWFMKNKGDYTKSFETEVAGVNHVFGWGGLHGAREKYYGKGLIVHVDVNSYYPSLMIRYDLLTRNALNKEKFKEIYDYRLSLKKAGKKKEQAPYKIVLNATYGIMKDKYSLAYDPLQANNVCVNGQLLLLDLIEKLESIEGFELIQSNTDGLIVKIPNTDKAWNELDNTCYEWESRTGMGLAFDVINYIYQGDVNNYVFEFENGKIERKGLYVKELNDLDNDLPIVNKALVDYLTKKIPIEDTINNCDELKMFQQICKASSKYKYLIKDGEILKEKTVRVFASNDIFNDGGLFKEHNNKDKADKFPNTPEHCFILNGDINNVKVPSRLDKDWYIDLANKRLYDKFGNV